MGDSRSIIWASVLVFVVVLAVYASTLVPTVPGGDAGELIVVAATGSVAHPPGYPLWTLLAGLFSSIPGGSMAWRVAWLSATATAAAAAVLFATVASSLLPAGARADTARAGDRPTAFPAAPASAMAGGLVAAGLFAFSPVAWTYAVSAEVFALHALLCALLFFAVLRWEQRRDLRAAALVALACGLGLANHHTVVFFAAPVVAWMLWRGRGDLLAARSLALLAGAVLVGLAPYVHLWLAGSPDHALSWGDTATVGGFLDHLLRRDYGTLQLLGEGHAASSSYAVKLAAYAMHFARVSLLVGAGLAVVAVAAAARSAAGSRRAGARAALPQSTSSWVLLVGGCALFYLGVFHALANVNVDDPLLRNVLARFWIQADLALCLLAGVGFGLLGGQWTAHRPGSGRAFAPAAVALVLAFVAVATSAGARADRGAAVVEDYGRAILEPLPSGALLLTSGDLITNVVRYLQACRHLREDVIVLDQELMTRSWYVRRMARRFPSLEFPGAFYHPRLDGGFSMGAFLQSNIQGRDVFVYPGWKSGDPSVQGGPGRVVQWTTWPEGLVARVLPAESSPDSRQWALESARALADLGARGWPRLDRYEAGTWERIALEDVWMARHERASMLIREAMAADDDPGLLRIARGELEAAERMHPDPPWYLFKNLGLVYDRLASGSPWLRGSQLRAWKRYLATAPEQEKDRDAIRSAVERLEALPPTQADGPASENLR